jgi:CRP-like cAMP-binding protein
VTACIGSSSASRDGASVLAATLRRRRERVSDAGHGWNVPVATLTLGNVKWRLLAGVPDEEVRTLLSVARRRSFSRGEVVFHHGDPADSLHLVARGRFAIRVRNDRGETVMVAVRGPGDNFGEMALVDPGATRSATVVALEACETFAVYRDEFEQLRRRYPAVNDAVTAFLAGEIRKLNGRLLEWQFVSADRRVLRRLGELAELYADGSGAVEVPLTQDDLAELAGTTRTTVNRALRKAEERGVVELRRGCTIVLDAAALERRAPASPAR